VALNRLTGQQFWRVLQGTAKAWWNDNALRLAASLAFYTTFSLAPTLLIVTGIAGLFFQGGATAQIERQVRDLMGPEGAAVIRGILDGVGREHQSSVLATLIGIGTLIIGSTAVFGELQAALNQIWDVKVDASRGVIGSLIRDRLLSFGVVLGIGFLLLVSLVVSAALAAARDWMAQGIPGLGWLWEVLNVLVSLALTTALFVLMYKLLPDVELAWRDVFVGAAVTAVLFSVGKIAIGLYVGRASVGSYYGAAGSFVVLLVWVYYSALVFFFGAEFTYVYAHHVGADVQPQEHAVRKGDKPDAGLRTLEELHA
jgi:membrane protein